MKPLSNEVSSIEESSAEGRSQEEVAKAADPANPYNYEVPPFFTSEISSESRRVY
jgi:hypothetical protein